MDVILRDPRALEKIYTNYTGNWPLPINMNESIFNETLAPLYGNETKGELGEGLDPNLTLPVNLTKVLFFHHDGCYDILK